MDEEINGPGLDEYDDARRRCDRPGAEQFSFWELLELRHAERGALVDVNDEPRVYSEHELA